MSNIRPYNRNLPAQYQHNGLNGLFSGWRKWAKKAVEVVGGYVASVVETSLPILGHEAATWIRSKVEELSDNLVLQGRTVNNDISTAEQQILDQWLQNNLKPWISKLVNQVVAARSLNGQQKVTALNAVLNQINAALAHYGKSGVPGVTSKEAKEDTLLVLTEVLKPIMMAVAAAVDEGGIATTPIKVNFPANNYSYAPLFTSPAVTTVSADNYQIKSAGSTTSNGGVTKVPTDKGSFNLDPNAATTTPGNVVKPYTEVITHPAISAATGDTTASTKKRTGLIVAISAFTLIAIAALSGKSKPAKAAN